MKVVLVATKSCHHRPLLERAFRSHDVPYSVCYFEDHPEIIEKFQCKESPLVLIDDKILFRGMPSNSELSRFLDERDS